ncbi:hypothetical protein J1614_001481 [Plenodomus biglobosus]|nr:hypothetical protein J1614_001481 [Plenodomus biglobosus]
MASNYPPPPPIYTPPGPRLPGFRPPFATPQSLAWYPPGTLPAAPAAPGTLPAAPGTQPDGQRAQPHMMPPNVFHGIPGIPHPNTPPFASNLTAYDQNYRQPPFPPASAWPPPSIADRNSWMSMLHHGLLPPPPLGAFSMPPASFPLPVHHHPMPPRFPPYPPPQSYPQPATPIGERIQEVRDREDGELSEGDAASRLPPARANALPPVEAARAVPQITSGAHVEETYNPDHPAAGQTPSKSSAPIEALRDTPPSLEEKIQEDREAAKQFVKTLHSSGIDYRTLAQEQLDKELLQGLYQSLNLPSEPTPIAPKSKANASEKPEAGHHTNQSNQPVDASKTKQVAPMSKTNAASTSTKPAVSAATRGDRTDYVARLQAARMAKQAADAKPSTPLQASQANSSANSSTPAPAAQATQATSSPAPVVKTPMTDQQRRARTTELVKQRLKELKGQPKPTVPVKNSAVAKSVTEQTVHISTQSEPPAANPSNNRGGHAPMPAFPGIPGLFMNAQSTSAPSPSIPQKRILPSDSTGASTPRGSATPYTRPLGQSPHAYHDEEEAMIIHVSDDESNGSEMDLDDDDDDDDESVQKPSSGSSAVLPNGPQDVGVLPHPGPRSGSVKPASSAVSTPGPQTPSLQAREKELVDKEKQLAAMRLTLKKKLAEKREKDRAAAAAAASVTTSSPLRQQSSTFGSRPENAIPSSTDGGTSTHAIADSGRDHKRQRRAELQSQLPTLEAEIANNATRMARLSEEMNRLLAENDKITSAKKQLTKELEDLGIDTEGMSHAQLRAKKDEIERENSPEKETPLQIAPEKSNLSSTEQIASTIEADVIESPGLPTHAKNTSTPLQSSAAPQEPAKSYSPVIHDTTGLHAPQGSNQPKDPDVNKTATSKEDIDLVERRSGTPPVDEEDSYSPPPPAEMHVDVETTAEATPRIPSQPTVSVPMSPSEEGEVEMSESSEEDEQETEYEPQESVIETEPALQDTQGPGTDVGRSLATSQVSTEDEEDYEPPDVDQEMPDVGVAQPGNWVPPVEADDGEMDMATSSSEETSDSDSDGETSSEPDSISGSNVLPQSTDTDHLASEWQVAEAAATNVPDSVISVEDRDEPIRFTPYESPLRMFKSYRYHPGYASEVAGGFLSWTFSHQIDPQKLLCQYESAGASCNNPACTDQHFRDIGITGEKLLVQLGTANPGETPEERQKWNDGLRGVLKELRVKNIKDPNGIAAEIAKYRRQFLNDETRVVNLPPAGQ